jgi:hypothetical protein
MLLTSAQKTLLAAHINANTNLATIPGSNGETFVINSAVQGRDPTLQQGIANWYMQAALANDAQPFANRNIWNPVTTIAQLNAAIKWNVPLVGATDAAINNSWLLWQTMIWNMSIDLTDPQVRLGVLTVFGDTANGSAKQIGLAGCGQQVGRNIELVLSGAVLGASTLAFAAAHVVQKDALGGLIYQQTIDAVDIDKALFPNG